MLFDEFSVVQLPLFLVSHVSDDNDFDEPMESSDSEMETDEEEWEDIDEPESSGDPANKNKGGRPLKPFATNGPTQRRVKLTEPYLACEKASKKHGIDFIPLLGKPFVHRSYTEFRLYCFFRSSC